MLIYHTFSIVSGGTQDSVLVVWQSQQMRNYVQRLLDCKSVLPRDEKEPCQEMPQIVLIVHISYILCPPGVY